MSSQGLTEEQRKKIEENRKRALALKANKCKWLATEQNNQRTYTNSNSTNNTHPYSSSCSTSSSFKNLSNFNFTSCHQQESDNFSTPPKQQNPKCGTTQARYNNTNVDSPHRGWKKSTFDIKSSHSSTSSTNNNPRLSASVNKETFYGVPDKVITGKCVLISQDRFCVDVGYHTALIEYCKQMETRNYDTASKTWSFLMTEYDKFYKGVKDFQPDVVIEPLPPIILKTFGPSNHSNNDKQNDSAAVVTETKADLSQVDQVLVNTLMPFQLEGINFAIHNEGRILLADEMGLGKTLQALCIARYYRSEWPLLIVAPSSVRFDWAQQLKKWLPSVDAGEVNVIDSGKGNVKEGSVCIISYDLVSKKVEDIKQRRFGVVIMDESHFLKTPKAIRTKAALAVTKLAKRVLLLSGTPALSRPIELFSQISICQPKIGSFHDFGIRYGAGKLMPWGWDYSGSSNLTELQILLEKNIMIRRQKADVLHQLPSKTRQVIVLNPALIRQSKDLSTALKIMHKASNKGKDARGALLQYFHESGNAKRKAVKDYVLDLVESDKKFLVFAHHKNMMDSLEEAFVENDKVKYIRIDGRTKSEHRSLYCQQFQTDEDCRVALLSITAANAGLNLSAANLVIFAELFWNPDSCSS